MRGGHYLRRRASAYQFRFALPRRLVCLCGRREILLGLGAIPYALAVQRARILRSRVEDLMAELSLVAVKADAERRIRAWIDAQIAGLENDLAARGTSYLSKREGAAMGADLRFETDALMRAAGRAAVEESLKPTIASILTGRLPLAKSDLGGLVADIGAEAGIDPAAAGAARPLIERVILRGFATWLDERFSLEDGDIAPVAAHVSAPIPEPEPEPAVAEPTLFAHWADFVADKLSLGDWKVDMAANAASSRRTFVALIGDVPASAITRTVAAKYRSDLLTLPRDYDKAARWRSLALPEVVEIVRQAQSSEPPEKIPTLSKTTANKHLTNISTYWGWLQDTGRIAESLANPFTKLKTKRLRGRAARQLRPMWPKELEAKLFGSPVWTGCQSIHRRSRPGPHILRDALFWLPLLGRTMGARSDELCSRAVGDVRFEGDVVYLAIRDTKNHASDRDVPIPAVILEFGFLEFRYYGRDPNEPLFPELIGQGVAGRHSEAFGNRFSHYRRQVGAYSAKVDFHSFRHNVTTDLENEPGVNPGWIDEITGHESLARTSESTRYTKLVYLRNLRSAIDRISLPVDLFHLKYQGTLGALAHGALDDIQLFQRLAEREMGKKAKP